MNAETSSNVPFAWMVRKLHPARFHCAMRLADRRHGSGHPPLPAGVLARGRKDSRAPSGSVAQYLLLGQHLFKMPIIDDQAAIQAFLPHCILRSASAEGRARTVSAVAELRGQDGKRQLLLGDHA